MVSIVIIAHAEIANSFVYCAEHVLGRRVEHLYLLPVRKTENVDSIYYRAQEMITEITSRGEEVLILSDLFGATPCNIAKKLVKKGQVELIVGLNLAMLIRAISYAKDDLATVCVKAFDGAVSGIMHISGEDK